VTVIRYRTVAASPARSASAAWQAITDLVAGTVAASSTLARADAEQAMAAAAPAGLMLIAGGHLDLHPVTLLVGLVHCEITTVPGAAGADTYAIHLPAPEPLTAVVAGAVAGHPRLTDAPPPAPAARAERAAAPLIDLDAVRKAVTGR
jgi:hypothetical protein